MKKLIIISALFLGFVTQAHASAIVDGKWVVGYVRDYKPAPEALIAPERPVDVVVPVFGNTSVMDMYLRLLKEDRDEFLKMIGRAKISY